MPSVAMKGGIFSLAMKVPETVPTAAPASNRAEDAERQRQAPEGQEHAGHHGAEGHQRADGKVDAAGDDDQRRGDGQHAVDGGRLQDAEDIAGLQEIGRGEAEHHHQHDQAAESQQPVLRAGKRREEVPVVGTAVVLIAKTPSPAVRRSSPRCCAQRRQPHDLLLRGAARQDAGQPSLAHDRDAVAETQNFGQFRGDDDDGAPFGGEAVEQLVDLALGADIDAARRLVEDQDIAVAQQPLGDDHLLLVAAGKKPALPAGRTAS